MKKNLFIAFVAIAFSSALFAAEPPLKMMKNEPSALHCKMHDEGNPSLMRGPVQNILFDVTIKSDDPVKTIKSMTDLIPASKAKQYQVRVSVIEVPEPKLDDKPLLQKK